MKRFAAITTFAVLSAFAAAGCKDSTPTRKSVPAPVSATVKPEVDTGREVSMLGTQKEPDALVDAYSFNGKPHHEACTEDHLGMAKGLLESGLVEAGIEELERGVFDQPESFELRRLLGESYRGSGELELAVGHLRAAVEQLDDVSTWQMLAQSYYELKDFEQSMTAIRKATGLDPTDPAPYRLLAKVYQSKNMWKESIEASEEAIARGSDSPWTYNNMGYAYLVIGRYEDAVRELEKAVSFDTGVTPTIWNNLGLAYEKKGDLRDAHSAYQAALAGNPNYVKAKVNASRVVQLAKAQGVDLGIRTAGVSRGVVETPVETTVETTLGERVVPAAPIFEIPSE